MLAQEQNVALRGQVVLAVCCRRAAGSRAMNPPPPPFAYSAPAPAFWQDGDGAGDVLEPERCVIDGRHYFLRGRLVLPVLDADDDFEWGVWVSVSKDNFFRAEELWDNPGRAGEPPYFGWLATELPGYEPGTLNLKTNRHRGRTDRAPARRRAAGRDHRDPRADHRRDAPAPLTNGQNPCPQGPCPPIPAPAKQELRVTPSPGESYFMSRNN
ncbi:DUF2199 domain-containing protein [Amycolatopsis sp. NPDC101161]|uniref:DUF2199 domain-containing protein n=1 Tax=Amycolatopsis sp. NPDC101161 TaxID=3363940 RepID=UPI00380729BA